ncbi:hypothetical protein [Hymenobacter sp. GOD-10R]|uniref:hypothetical protein n=1 Tax=Hymenobacter sp. GOD-10R TaxID=3093922 RepID=UPI002D76EAC4|nr:hypothetical protein [Hymenobacter sp. GOD-10R]WRQ31633.1 hypothetical protein SD425_27765 [Hymenobacter sp. GOD-10R]
MGKRFLFVGGDLLALPILLFVGLVLYRGAEGAIAAFQHRFLPPTRMTIVWPSEWECDEYHQAYRVLKMDYPNSLVRYLFHGTSLLVPYPRGRAQDTTAFYRYYQQQVRHGRRDTVVVRARLGYDIRVGEPGLDHCPDIPYVDVSAVYSKRGKLLKRFSQ